VPNLELPRIQDGAIAAGDAFYSRVGGGWLKLEAGLPVSSDLVRDWVHVPIEVLGRGLAESALGAPAAGFGDHQHYPTIPMKVAVLLQRIASNHALPDGNKRTALLCAIFFSNLNGLAWDPPSGDEPDGIETAEVVEAAAAGVLPFGALTA
jgi:prophage maintenance system killer protein